MSRLLGAGRAQHLQIHLKLCLLGLEAGCRPGERHLEAGTRPVSNAQTLQANRGGSSEPSQFLQRLQSASLVHVEPGQRGWHREPFFFVCPEQPNRVVDEHLLHSDRAPAKQARQRGDGVTGKMGLRQPLTEVHRLSRIGTRDGNHQFRGGCKREPASQHQRLQGRGQPARQREASRHPAHAATRQLRHRFQRLGSLFDELPHQPSLFQG